jgi:hypothetical protein
MKMKRAIFGLNNGTKKLRRSTKQGRIWSLNWLGNKELLP